MLHVRLVANEEDALLGNALLQSLIEVIVAPFDARFIRKIKDNHTPLRTFEVGGSEGSKLLLPGCVPDLQLVQLIIDGGRVCLEVNTNGGLSQAGLVHRGPPRTCCG